MIKIRIKNGDHEIDIRFPISESELYAKLAEVHAIEGRDAPQSAFVTEVYWPEEFFMLKDRFANLDELNYLARRMESFDYNEYDQFLVGITKLENPTEKDLINLTFNLDHFTLCKDVSSYGTIGRTYECAPNEFSDNSTELNFWTAWAPPHPVLQMLSEQYPELEIFHEWADEDIGMNCGRREYKSGDLIYEYYPEGDEATAFACELWGLDPSEETNSPVMEM